MLDIKSNCLSNNVKTNPNYSLLTFQVLTCFLSPYCVILYMYMYMYMYMMKSTDSGRNGVWYKYYEIECSPLRLPFISFLNKTTNGVLTQRNLPMQIGFK